MQAAIFAEFGVALDPTRLRLVNFPSRIFLCGGEVDSSRDATNALSVRDAYLRHIKANNPEQYSRVLLAERIVQWYQEDHYGDLLALEADLAGFSDLTLLFVESPGSIAELGAFTLLETLAPRVLAVVKSQYRTSPSFINLGPVRRLQNQNCHPVLFYPWPANHEGARGFCPTDWEEQALDLAEKIDGTLKQVPEERAFRFEEPSHMMVLIADLVEIARVAKRGDLLQFIEALETTSDVKTSTGKANINRKRLDQFLFVLERLGLVRQIGWGDDIYVLSYSPSELRKPLLHLAFKPDVTNVIRDRWQADFLAAHRRGGGKRLSALRAFERGDIPDTPAGDGQL